jgi:CMP-N-acetylneuraminic acid synthetase|tara:strand:- start:302 stop:979 length:678 start_codon:yes stop_codon:yes gene_type:complete
MKISAVIIARKGSKRLKNKLYRKFKGKTLIEHKISQLLKSSVDEIIVGSNDNQIEKICKKFKGKKIIFFKRQDNFCDEISSTPNEMVSNMLQFFKTDVVLWAHLTNPLTNNIHYDEAINIFKKKFKKGYDSLHSVSESKNYFWNKLGNPINHNPLEKIHNTISTGKIDPLYTANGAIFIREHSKMLNDGRFWGKKRSMYKMNYADGWDINTLWELESCQLKSFTY